ncbi:MAG: hypothetical protein XD52_1287 [bacterium 42_11]|nr:MAG: hypothetical protein XD52_1287 [bacterium 42_11]
MLFKIAPKLRALSIVLLLSIALGNFFYLRGLEEDLKKNEVLGASVLSETVSFLFRTRIGSLVVMLHSLNYADIPLSKEDLLKEWLLVLYRAYGSFVLLSGFIDENGKIVATYPKDETLEGRDVSSWRAFKVVKGSRISFIGGRISTYGGKDGIGVFAPLFGEKREVKGVLFYVYNYHILNDALRDFLRSSGKPWDFLILDGEGNLFYGKREVADAVKEKEWGRTGSFKLDGVDFSFVHTHIPLGVASDWHLFLYAPSRSLLGGFGSAISFLKYAILVIAVLISFAIYYFHRGEGKPNKGRIEKLREGEVSVEGETGTSLEKEEGEEEGNREREIEEVFPGTLLKLSPTLEIVYAKGIRGDLREIDKEELKKMVIDGEGTLKAGDRVYFFKVAPLEDGGFLLFGEDRTREEGLVETFIKNIDHLLLGKLSAMGKDFKDAKEVLPLEENKAKRIKLNSFLLSLKERLPFDIKLELGDLLPSPWVNPLYLRRLLLFLILKIKESNGEVALKTGYIREKAVVTLSVCIEGVSKLFEDEDVDLFLYKTLASRSGIKIEFLSEGCVLMELPIYSDLGEGAE